uniref:PHD-type domain-containing protein n=1 Tax=Parastrongyloides trichosuri TaxID=131310 RepID=A0A0N4ZMI9_PARTI
MSNHTSTSNSVSKDNGSSTHASNVKYEWIITRTYEKSEIHNLRQIISQQHSPQQTGGVYRYYECKELNCPARLRYSIYKDKDGIFLYTGLEHSCGYDWSSIVNGDIKYPLPNTKKLGNNKNKKGKRKSAGDIVVENNKKLKIDRKALSDLDDNYGEEDTDNTTVKKNDSNINDEDIDLNKNHVPHVVTEKEKLQLSPKGRGRRSKKFDKKPVNCLEFDNGPLDSILDDEEDFDCGEAAKDNDSSSELSSSDNESEEETPIINKRPKRQSVIRAMELKKITDECEKNNEDDYKESDDDDFDIFNEQNGKVKDKCKTLNNVHTPVRRFNPYEIYEVNTEMLCGFCLKDDNTHDILLECLCCEKKVHEHCYYVRNTFQPDRLRKTSQWFCNECLSGLQIGTCIACHRQHGVMKQTNNGWIHGFCALYNNDIIEGCVGNLEGPFYLAKTTAQRKGKCTFCEYDLESCTGFTIKCEADKCNVKYHPMCGLKCGATFNIYPDDKYRNLATTHCPLHTIPECDRAKSHSIYLASKTKFKRSFYISDKMKKVQDTHKKVFFEQKKLMDDAYKNWLFNIKNEDKYRLTTISTKLYKNMVDKHKKINGELDLQEAFVKYCDDNYVNEKMLKDKKNCDDSESMSDLLKRLLEISKKVDLMIPKINKKKLENPSIGDCNTIVKQIYEQLVSIHGETVSKIIENRENRIEECIVNNQILFVKGFLKFKKGFNNQCDDKNTDLWMKENINNLCKCLQYFIAILSKDGSQD